ncbi:MAG: pyridoxamine 5'-phosphate oxidase family protein [Clostridiales bacterium]|jgi:uncharacterized pyridoxamine 5'-phosphate oxidase family protein|nr:pyridoxamine 5'-phosphate oxidase family protein [Clostridiales bacterium]
MKDAIKFLQDCKTFYVATTDAANIPHVRPFGIMADIGGKLCMATGSGKVVYNQIKANPNVEVCATAGDGTFLRIIGTVYADETKAARERYFTEAPILRQIYADREDKLVTLVFDKARAVYQTMAGEITEKTLY